MRARRGPWRRPRAWAHALAAAAMVAVPALLPASCASGGGARQHAEGKALGELAAAAERERKRPDRKAMRAPPPPGLDDGAMPRDVDGSDAARQPMAEALAALSRDALPPAPIDSGLAPPGREEATHALRLYARGRESLLRGDPAAAVQSLSKAAELDPASGELWLALGEAYFASGSRPSAVQSLERAARLGAGGHRPWELLGREAFARRDAERAARFLARAVELSGGEEDDPATALVVRVELAQALDEVGLTRAARDSLAEALELLDRLEGAARFRPDAAAIARRAGDLWQAVGDLSARTGDYEAAAAAYGRAWLLPGFGPAHEDLAPRRMHALMRLGRPSAAALTVLETVRDRRGWADDATIALCRHLAAESRSGPLLERALADLAAQGHTPAIITRLTLARAACLHAEPARRLLRDHLRSRPGAPEAVTTLIALALEPVPAAAELERLCRQAPFHSDLYAWALLSSGRPVDPVVAELDRSPTAAGALLAARVLARTDRVHPAARRIADARERAGRASRTALAVETAAAEIAASEGRWEEAAAAIDRLDHTGWSAPRDEVLWSRASALAAVQRYAPALALLAPLADAPPSGRRVEHLLAAAELASRMGAPGDAEALLERALTLDPFDERVYGRLIELHAGEEAKAAEALRRLRQRCPGGRLMRTLRAQELARRVALVPAQHELLELARDLPGDRAVLELLVRVSAALAARGLADENLRVEAFLREAAGRAPEVPLYTAALAEFLAATGRAVDAESLLRERLAASWSTELARQRERILRQSLSRAEEADRLAYERLRAHAASIEDVLELAEVLEARGEIGAAVAALHAGLPPAATLSPPQTGALVRIVERLANEAKSSLDAAERAQILAAIELALERGAILPPVLHERRLELLTENRDLPAAAVFDATRVAQRQIPTLGPRAYLVVLAGLVAAENRAGEFSRRPIDYIALAAQAEPEPPLLAAWLQLTAHAGTPEDARALLERAIDSGGAPGLYAELVKSGEAEGPLPPREHGAMAAELAYLMGARASAFGRDDFAAAVYRLALTHNPAHGWALNNLGYHLIESARSEDGTIDAAMLDEGHRLLERAAAALPHEPSVLDSIGWARYRTGMLHDATDGNGAVVREGAITLLRRAAALPDGDGNPVIMDHLGDALWAAGETAAAVRTWTEAIALAKARLEFGRREGWPAPMLEETSALGGGIQLKLAAARAGEEPPLAWRLGSPAPAPE